MEATNNEGESWPDAKGRRAHREYASVQAMLDDIWQANQNGWLPLSMTEQRQRTGDWKAPWKWLRKGVTYLVTYRHAGR